MKKTGAQPVVAEIKSAIASLETFDEVAALAAILRAWRQVRSPDLAEAIGALSLRFDTASRRPHGGTADDRRAQWLDIAGQHDPVNIASLLATIDDDVNQSDLIARVRILSEGEPDPRIAVRLVTMMRHPIPSRMSDAWRPFWTDVLKTIRAMGDPRMCALEKEITRHITPTTPPKNRWFNRELADDVFATIGDHERLPEEIDPSIHEATAKLKAILFGGAGASGSKFGTLTELFDKVYAKPADNAARAVLADLLQEIKDPRGELIALQLSPKGNKKRETELLKEHRTAWLGGLAPVIKEKASVVFQRGFLTECTIACDEVDVANAIVTRPEWSTVEKLTMNATVRDVWNGDVSLLLSSPTMRSLQDISGIRSNHLTKLTRPLAKLERIELVATSDKTAIELSSAAPMLPKLTHLNIGYVGYGESVTSLLTLPLVQRLKVIEADVAASDGVISLLGDALREQRLLSAELVRAKETEFSWSLTRKDGRLAVLTFVYPGRASRCDIDDTLRSLLAIKTERGLPTIEVIRIATHVPNPEAEQRLTETLTQLKSEYPKLEVSTSFGKKPSASAVAKAKAAGPISASEYWGGDY